MTIPSIAKTLLGVKNIHVESMDMEITDGKPTLIIHARPYKRDICRCGICGKEAPGYDQGRGMRRWRAPDIGEEVQVYVESDARRVDCPEHGATVHWVPWARHGAGFTRNFEDAAAWLSLRLSKAAVAEYLRVKWETVGNILTRVEKEKRRLWNPYDNLKRIGIDETSYKKGHKYLTVIVNHDTNTVVWVAKGYGKSVLEEFFAELSDEQKAGIQLVSGDGARWIRDTVNKHCPNAAFCIDPFHVVSWCTEALDEVRREEWNKAKTTMKEEEKKAAENKETASKKDRQANQTRTQTRQAVNDLRGMKYPLLMNPDKLREEVKAKLEQTLLRNKRLSTAYTLKEDLRLIFQLPADEVGPAIDKWRRRAWSCRIPQFVELQKKIKRHKDAIISTITYGISNARIEATNNKIKLTIRMAYGFRNIENLISLILLRFGGIPFSLPGRSDTGAA